MPAVDTDIFLKTWKKFLMSGTCHHLRKTALAMSLSGIAGFILLCSSISFAALDNIQSQLLQQYAQPLRWDNVEGEPEWVDGVKPAYNFSRKMHVVHLSPGDSVTLRIPPREMLRLTCFDAQCSREDLDISISNGSGLYAFLPVQAAEDTHSLLLSPDASRVLLASIQRPAHSQDAIDVGIFISRRETLGEIAPYRELVKLPTEKVKITEDHRPRSRSFWLLNAAVLAGVEIQGPARLVLEHRYIYPPSEHERTQAYQVFAYIDGKLSQVMEFETVPEMHSPVYADGSPQVTGRLETGYLDIPAGKHLLELQPTVDVYARLLMQKAQDYLLPKFNKPTPNAARIREQHSTKVLHESLWDILEQTIRALVTDKESSPSELERAALRTVRDNSRREGGLTGSMLMQQAASRHRKYSRVQGDADELLGIHTFYRDLLPSRKVTPQPQKFYRFLNRRLKESPEQKDTVVAAEQHLDSLLDSFPGAYFAEIPAQSADDVTTYHLPPRFSRSVLRVIVGPSSSEQEFMLQFDNEPPLRFRTSDHIELADKEYQFSLGEIGLAISHAQHQEPGLATQFSSDNMNRTPIPLIDAKTCEIPIPPEVSSIKVFRTNSESAPDATLMLALQYRVSKSYRLSESDYLRISDSLTHEERKQHFMKLLGEPSGSIRRQMPSEAQLSEERELLKFEFSNYCLPLLRFLRSRARAFNPSIKTEKHYSSSSEASSTSCATGENCGTSIETLIQQAKMEEQEEQWLLALETWTEIYHRTEGVPKNNAQFSRITALRQLDEEYLAEHLLKTLLLDVTDESAQMQAFTYLEALYREEEDRDSLIALYASSILHKPTTEVMKTLIEILVEEGDYQLALLLGLLLPTSEQPASMLLRATFQVEWWNVFQALLGQCDAPERHYWMGQRASKHGRYDDALQHFYQAGSQGLEWAQLLEDGRQIYGDLTSSEPETREKAILAWERWQMNHPGPFIWQNASHFITDYAGAEDLYSVSRDLYMRAFRATASKPVKLQVLGPLHLRVEARPLHSPESNAPVDGWVYIRETEELHIFPVNQNRPGEGIQRIGPEQWQVGRRVSVEYVVEPGLHEIEISADTFPLLARIFVKQPEIRAGVLPPFTQDTLLAGLQGNLAQIYENFGQRGISRLRDSNVIILPQDRDAAVISLDAGSADITSGTQEFQLHSPDVLQEKLELFSHPKQEAPNPSKLQSLYLAAGNVDKALELPPGSQDEDLLKRMSLLVWVAERQPERLPDLIPRAEELYAAHPEIPELKTLLERMNCRKKWTRITSIQSSAGLRSVDMSGWQPESPSLRARKTLLPAFDPNEHVLYDANQLVLSLNKFVSSELEVTLKTEDVANLPPCPMTVSWQLDEQQAQTVVLLPENPQHQVHIPVSAGEHSLRIGINKKVANQFLRIMVRERSGKEDSTWLSREQKRSYHIATHAEPLSVELEGPARIRIDELRDGKTWCVYQNIEPGWQNLTLFPRPGQEESLLRLFQETLSTGSEETPARITETVSEPVAEPLFRIFQPVLEPSVMFRDDYALGGQEDGTLTFSTDVSRRRNLQEDANDSETPDDFLEIGATYRHFHEDRKLYSRSKILGRIREDAGPTVGGEGQIAYSFTSLPFDVRLNGQFYLQRPESVGSGKLEWLGELSGTVLQVREIGPKSFHTPSLSMFGRSLSMETDEYESGRVDQDIFTSYKADHKSGIRIADTFTYRPWLDTIWFAGGTITSNNWGNMFPPDHLLLRTGWKQLIGDVQLNAQYHYTQYFSDSDRHDASHQHLLGLELSYNTWFSNQHRLETALNIYQRLDSGETTGTISFSWHLGNGRAYRDFRSGEVDFLGIRKRRVPQEKNNAILNAF